MIQRNALLIEFREAGIPYETEKVTKVYYHEHLVGTLRLDLIVAGELVIELKVQPQIEGSHLRQLVSYLHATRLETGLLINLGGPVVEFRTKYRTLPPSCGEPPNF